MSTRNFFEKHDKSFMYASIVPLVTGIAGTILFSTLGHESEKNECKINCILAYTCLGIAAAGALVGMTAIAVEYCGLGKLIDKVMCCSKKDEPVTDFEGLGR